MDGEDVFEDMATQIGLETDDDNRAAYAREPMETGYFIWKPEGSAVAIEVHPDVMDGIARDISESAGTEVGGLLLGTVISHGAETGRALVRIDRFHRVPCAHAAGPEYILDEGDLEGLERTAAAVLDGGELTAVGLYRSHLRLGLEIEPSDSELIDRYFHEPFDLILLIKPEADGDMSGSFSVYGADSLMRQVGGAFPYHFRQTPSDANAFTPPTLRSRRLVPDFVPETVKPAEYRITGEPEAGPREPGPDLETPRANWTKWWPLPASLLVAGASLWLLLSPTPGRIGTSPAAPAVSKTEVARPLGLFAAKTGDAWRVSWNPNATALRDARSVQLFVREGDEQTRIDLPPQALASGAYEYKPLANDVMFRLEVTDKAGHVSAESFRFEREIPPPAPATGTPPPAVQKAPKATAPRATHKVPPTIPDSVRSRITGTVVVEVRVRIDSRGRVVSATPLGKRRGGLDSYLAGRAVEAARMWRFDPARENGKPTTGEQTIRFTFTK